MGKATNTLLRRFESKGGDNLQHGGKKQIIHKENTANQINQLLAGKITIEGITKAKKDAENVYLQEKNFSPEWKQQKLASYDLLLENIDEINEGNVFALKYKNTYFSTPHHTQILSNQDVGTLSLGSTIRGAEGERSESIMVFRIARKKLIKDKIYCGSFYVGGVVDVFQKPDGKLFYRTNFKGTNQDREEATNYDMSRWEIESGEEGTMKEYNTTYEQIKHQNANRYNLVSNKVLELYGKEVLDAVKAHKGYMLSILEKLIEPELSMRLIDKKADVAKGLRIAVDQSKDTVLTLLLLIAYEPDLDSIIKVFGESQYNNFEPFCFATSWTHYKNILGNIPTVGKMQCIANAYKIYCNDILGYTI